ncbi:hypothetical protein NLX86_19695 [Streptomyces sp. A3M-1-3]|uniref:hypothetical protein n=1 Tax=Streptomyces sp. A3M-1-3 TaxID=2962044 RepID=UPI0020B84412|nr:hypothetical protein [Streptomyces sp. A3M-1-3]MCP3820242.1 hypothetical protein [Streptomyces sp. A3M-1-3]
MAMTPRQRKLALTAHVTASVGWLGAVAVFLALAVAGLTSQDVQRARSAYVAMEISGWYVIVPLAFASLLTGVLSAVGTTWGLVRYYWVVVKLVITVLATIALLVHMQPVSSIADAAAGAASSGGALHEPRVQLVIQSAAASLALLVATALSVYKPQGRTHYGQRKQYQQRTRPEAADSAAPAGPAPLR